MSACCRDEAGEKGGLGEGGQTAGDGRGEAAEHDSSRYQFRMRLSESRTTG